MPTGTGKTISLLALFVSYIIAYPEKYSKVIIIFHLGNKSNLVDLLYKNCSRNGKNFSRIKIINNGERNRLLRKNKSFVYDLVKKIKDFGVRVNIKKESVHPSINLII